MTFLARLRDLRRLPLVVCLTGLFLFTLSLIGWTMLQPTFASPPSTTLERTQHFVCTNDEAGTLLLCEHRYTYDEPTCSGPWINGSTTSRTPGSSDV